MTGVAELPLLPETRRRVARRAGLARWRGAERVPRLRTGPRHPGTPPTVWVITPDWNRVAGGVRKLYRAVDVLNAGGVCAAVVHERRGFACTWFDHDTRIVTAADVVVAPGDVIAVPEIYGASIAALPPGVPRVVFNQGAYLALDALAADPAAASVYTDPDLAAVVVVSEDSADVLRYAFPSAPVVRIRHGVDPALHRHEPGAARRRIAYMPRRRAEDAARVLALLELRGALEGWEVVAIRDRSEREAAELLRGSRIFLSFSQAEGFGLPPLEALASGCLVVGFHGFGGRELFKAPFAQAIEDGDVVAFARAVEETVRRCDSDPAGMAAAAAEGAAFAHRTYSRSAEHADLLAAFAPLLAA